MFDGTYEAKNAYIKSSDFTQSPFRYPGGKYYALKFIIPFLDAYPHDEYREPFVGGGSVFFGKRKAEINWINDLEDKIISIYKTIQDTRKCQRLIDRVAVETASRERHSQIKLYKPRTAEDIAFKTYYLNRTSYSGIIHKPAWGYEIGYSSPPPNWPRFLRGANIKLQDVKITTMDFKSILDAPAVGKRLLFYLDPPYYLADQKRAYTKSFKVEDHHRLQTELKRTKHAFLLSYDDCPQVRQLYAWANIYEKSWFYNTANSSGPRPMGKELFITNYKVVHSKQLELL